MFLSVSASIARERTARKYDSTLVCCVIHLESFVLYFSPPTTISAVLRPLSQLRSFHLAILPLCSTLIQSAHSLFTLFWIEKAGTFCGSNPGMNSREEGEMSPKYVIINEVPCQRVCVDKVLLWVTEPYRERSRFANTERTLKTPICFETTLSKSIVFVCVCVCVRPWTTWTVQSAWACKVGRDIKLQNLIGP